MNPDDTFDASSVLGDSFAYSPSFAGVTQTITPDQELAIYGNNTPSAVQTTWSIDPAAVNAVGSLANSASSVIRSLTGGNVGYGYGGGHGGGNRIDPITGLPVKPTGLAGVASSLTGVLTSFLPIILIVGAIYLVFKVAGKHGR